MSPPGVKEKSPPLDKEVEKQLGNLKPLLAAEQIRILANQAMELYEPEAQELEENYNLPIDFSNLTEVLELFDPNKLLNEFHWINPDVNLQNLMKEKPVKVFEGVVRILTVSDR